LKNGLRKYITPFLWILLVIGNLYKLILINAGFLTEPDEYRYMWSWQLLKKLHDGEFLPALQSVFSADARPGAVLIHTIPAVLQFPFAEIMGYEIFETRSFAVVFVYNLVIHILVLWVFYKILLLIFYDKNSALFGVLIFSVSVNHYAYLRHIYPYNESLLIFLFLIYRFTDRLLNRKKIRPADAFIWGALAFAGILIYPAYYLSFIGVYLFFLWMIYRRKKLSNDFLKINFAYFSGAVTVLFLTEIISGIAGISYIDHALKLSGTVSQGSYKESFSFAIKYLFEVEKFTGLLLITGMLFFVIIMFIKKRPATPRDEIIKFLSVSFFIAYLIHAVLGYFFSVMTMYGRILHQFIWVIILVSIYALRQVEKEKRIYLIYFFSVLIFVQFLWQIHHYTRFSYPKDVYWKYLKSYPASRIIEISEYEKAGSNIPPLEVNLYTNYDIRDTVILVNGFYFYPFDDSSKWHSYTPPPGYELIFKNLHFINFKAYQYEGYAIEERRLIDSIRPVIRMYKKK